MHTIFTDIEVFHDFFFIGFKREHDGKRVGVEFSRRNPRYDRDFVRRILMRNETVGYNSLPFDLPLIWFSLDEKVDNARLKRASDGIIKGGLKPWEVEDFLGIRLPWELKNRHIDLREPQPNAFASLKLLNGRMHGNRLQDLPFDPDIVPTDEQMDVIADYCLHSDLDATENLWRTLAEPLQLRRALGEKHDTYFMSKSDAQIGEAIVKKRVEQMTNRKVEKNPTKPGTSFHYPVPEWVRFERPELQALLDRVRNSEFVVGTDGKTKPPEWMKGDGAKIALGTEVYSFGIGGIHSTEAGRATRATETHALIDADVASQYPAAILMLGLYPPALGPEFLVAYRAIREERLAAKARAKEIKVEKDQLRDRLDELGKDGVKKAYLALEQELVECQVKDKGGKIQLNGVYGKLGSRYSILYAPHLLLSVTLTCQLSILMLIERALAAGINVVSGNTDGVLFQCPREFYAGLKKDRLNACRLEEVCSQWESDTGFDLEFGEYSAIYNLSVNSYYAIKPDGGHKRKGPIGNPWNKHPSDFDVIRGQLMKNPTATICSDAALALIKDGTPVEQTIRASCDIREFVSVITVNKGATWKGEYLGRVARFYWGHHGAPVMESVPHPTTGNFKKVPKSEGAIPCMDLPDQFPDDIDYARYVEETESILKALGYYGEIKPPQKRIRITKANRLAVLSEWSSAP